MLTSPGSLWIDHPNLRVLSKTIWDPASLLRQSGLSCAPEILYFLSSAAAVSNSWGLGGVEEAPGGITNWTKCPKCGHVPFSSPFPFLQTGMAALQKEKLASKLSLPTFGISFSRLAKVWGLFFLCCTPFVRRKMHHKPWKFRAGLVLPPLTFLHLWTFPLP